jgi:hypothetical protein
VFQEAVDDAGPVEPGRHREPPRHRRGLEEADLLHPPDVQLQVRPPRGEWVQAALGAPGQVAAQIGFGVVTRRALEPGQVGGHRQPQLVSERRQMIGGAGRQVSGVHHAQTLGLIQAAAKPPTCQARLSERCVPFRDLEGVAPSQSGGLGLGVAGLRRRRIRNPGSLLSCS